MAKLIGPLFSESAHGSISKRLTYSKRKSGNQARFQRANHDYNSTSQQTQRALFLVALGKWNSLTNAHQTLWREYNAT